MRTLYPIDLPQDWSADQARAVFEFLDELKEHIGHVYGADIVELCRSEHEEWDRSIIDDEEGFSDEIPF